MPTLWAPAPCFIGPSMRCTSVLVPHPTCTAGRSPCRPCRSRQHLPSRLPGGSGCRWSQDRTPAFPRWGCFIGGGAGKAGLQGHVTKRTLCKLRKRYPGPWEPLIRGLWPSPRPRLVCSPDPWLCTVLPHCRLPSGRRTRQGHCPEMQDHLDARSPPSHLPAVSSPRWASGAHRGREWMPEEA